MRVVQWMTVSIAVGPPADWTSLAAIPGVGWVEPAHLRKLANDQDRVTVGVSTDNVTETNYLNLTGTNIFVELNDTGIDPNHPDFAQTTNGGPSRVIGWVDPGSTKLSCCNGC